MMPACGGCNPPPVTFLKDHVPLSDYGRTQPRIFPYSRNVPVKIYYLDALTVPWKRRRSGAF